MLTIFFRELFFVADNAIISVESQLPQEIRKSTRRKSTLGTSGKNDDDLDTNNQSDKNHYNNDAVDLSCDANDRPRIAVDVIQIDEAYDAENEKAKALALEQTKKQLTDSDDKEEKKRLFPIFQKSSKGHSPTLSENFKVKSRNVVRREAESNKKDKTGLARKFRKAKTESPKKVTALTNDGIVGPVISTPKKSPYPKRQTTNGNPSSDVPARARQAHEKENSKASTKSK